MSTLETICRQILDIDPALRSTVLIDRLPRATITPLRSGCRISLRVTAPDFGVSPDLTVEFDTASQVTAITWRQMFNDINTAFDVFCDLDRMARKRMLVVPKIFNSVGTRRFKAHLSHTWAISMHQRIDLHMDQPVPRTLGREVIFRHSLRQPHAMIAAAPRLWTN